MNTVRPVNANPVCIRMNVLKNSAHYSIIININIVIKIILFLRRIKIVSNDFNIIIFTSLQHLKSGTYKLASRSMMKISWSCRSIFTINTLLILLRIYLMSPAIIS